MKPFQHKSHLSVHHINYKRTYSTIFALHLRLSHRKREDGAQPQVSSNWFLKDASSREHSVISYAMIVIGIPNVSTRRSIPTLMGDSRCQNLGCSDASVNARMIVRGAYFRDGYIRAPFRIFKSAFQLRWIFSGALLRYPWASYVGIDI